MYNHKDQPVEIHGKRQKVPNGTDISLKFRDVNFGRMRML